MVLREHLRSVRTRKTTFDGPKDYIKYYLLRAFVIFVFIISHVYDYTTYPIYWIIYHPWLVRRYRRAIHSKLEQREDCVIYHSLDERIPVYIEINENNLTTLDAVFDYAVNKYKEKECLGTRKIISEEDEVQSNGKVFKKYDLGDYTWSTYEQFQEKAIKISQGLLQLGLKPKETVAILAETRAEWLVTAYACYKQNLPIVTIYTNLGSQGIVHALLETEASCVFCSNETLPKLINISSECSKTIKNVVVMTSQLHSDFDSTQMAEGIKVCSFEDLLDYGTARMSAQTVEFNKPTPHDTAIIMYTSGSTGKPKGVMLTHSNIVSSMLQHMNHFAPSFTPDDCYIAFLPQAHVLELIVETVLLLCSVKIGYSSPLTLLDTSSKVKKGVTGDTTCLKPTLMSGVPLILERIYKNIVENVRKNGWVFEELFHYFVNYKIKWHDRGFDTPLLNKTLFPKIRNFLGGNVQFMLSGGAPLSPDTHALTRTCFCVPVITAYALTETTSCATALSPMDTTTGRVGAPEIDVKVKLVNWEEGKYLITDQPHPRGEIHIGGNNVALGYYKNPEKTAEEFYDEEGTHWFRTGDIGEFENDGVLKIIDRKKDLVKLQTGEYVSYGKVESILKTHELVENICLYADPLKDFTIAIAVPNMKALQAITGEEETNLNRSSEEICKDENVMEKVIKTLITYGLKNGLEKFEVPKKIALFPEEWTPDSGEVTAALKIKRLFITKKYENEIKLMYKD